MLKRATTIATTIALVSACSSPGPAPTTAPTTTTTTQSTAATSETPTTTTPESPIGLRGIIVMTCPSRDQIKLTVLEPVTATEQPLTTFKAPMGTVRFDCDYVKNLSGGLSAPMFRQVFNRNFSKIAVSTLSSDGGKHVGYADAGGNVTDVSAQLTPGGFASTAAKHEDAVFGPKDQLYYEDKAAKGDNVFSVDLGAPSTRNDGGAATPATPRPAGSIESGALLVGPDGSVHGAGGYSSFPSPGGKAYASYQPFKAAVGIKVKGAKEIRPVEVGGGCLPLGWLDDSRLVCTTFKGSYTLGIVTFTADYTRGELKQLVPATDRSLQNAVAAPDGNRFAFISTQGALTGLYVGRAAGGEPTKVVDVTKTTILLGWV